MPKLPATLKYFLPLCLCVMFIIFKFVLQTNNKEEKNRLVWYTYVYNTVGIRVNTPNPMAYAIRYNQRSMWIARFYHTQFIRLVSIFIK